MKKTLPMVIIGILILSGLGAADTSVDQTNSCAHRDDWLDQIQDLTSGNMAIGAVGETLNFSGAQEFIPTISVLTRVELYIKNGDLDATYPYIVSIRDNLTGENLRYVGVNPEDIGHALSWVEFDFKDISVTIGQPYYIVSYTVREEDNTYHWGWQYPDTYLNGTSYIRLQPEDPYGETGGDYAFKTYGRENTPPETPDQPDGPIEGIINVEYTYTTSATDPDDEDLEYGWDWDGDDTVDEWTTEETASHVWSEPGTYDIKVKARDEVGEPSDFSPPLTVEIIGETELDIEFNPGLQFTVDIINIGGYEAIDMVWSVDITGGILGLINVSLEGDAVLAVDDQIIVQVPFLFGFGPINIVAKASATNAEEVTEIWDGFIIFIFILGN